MFIGRIYSAKRTYTDDKETNHDRGRKKGKRRPEQLIQLCHMYAAPTAAKNIPTGGQEAAMELRLL
jgi:hypothetical protein